MSEQEQRRDDAPAEPGDDRWEMEPERPVQPGEGTIENEPSPHQGEEGQEPA